MIPQFAEAITVDGVTHHLMPLLNIALEKEACKKKYVRVISVDQYNIKILRLVDDLNIAVNFKCGVEKVTISLEEAQALTNDVKNKKSNQNHGPIK